MSVRAKPMGTSDVTFLDDSSDLGSLECKGANGLCDGDLATAVGFTSEPRIRCEPSEAMVSAPRTSRSGQFEGWELESWYQPENCCLTQFILDEYHSPLRSRFYRSGRTTQQIASASFYDCACVLTELKCEDICAMAPDLLRWGDDLESESADYNDDWWLIWGKT